VRTAIVSTYPPRACGIGTFAANLRRTLLGVAGLEGADIVAVVNEPSRPQRRGLLSVNGQAVRGDYVRAARTLGLWGAQTRFASKSRPWWSCRPVTGARRRAARPI